MANDQGFYDQRLKIIDTAVRERDGIHGGAEVIQKHMMIAINWYGPYRDIDEARQAAKQDYEHGLYMGIGKLKSQRRSSMQYIGIGSNIHARMTDRHHKLSLIRQDRVLWLGEVATAEPSGRKVKVTRASLDYAEWLHARFLQLPLNEKKTKTLPQRSVTVMNRWFHIDYETIHAHRPHPDWPDLIDFPDYNLPARAVWFGQRQRKFSSPDYALPG